MVWERRKEGRSASFWSIHSIYGFSVPYFLFHSTPSIFILLFIKVSHLTKSSFSTIPCSFLCYLSWVAMSWPDSRWPFLGLSVVLGLDVLVHRAQMLGNSILVDMNKCLLTIGRKLMVSQNKDTTKVLTSWANELIWVTNRNIGRVTRSGMIQK